MNKNWNLETICIIWKHIEWCQNLYGSSIRSLVNWKIKKKKWKNIFFFWLDDFIETFFLQTNRIQGKHSAMNSLSNETHHNSLRPIFCLIFTWERVSLAAGEWNPCSRRWPYLGGAESEPSSGHVCVLSSLLASSSTSSQKADILSSSRTASCRSLSLSAVISCLVLISCASRILRCSSPSLTVSSSSSGHCSTALLQKKLVKKLVNFLNFFQNSSSVLLFYSTMILRENWNWLKIGGIPDGVDPQFLLAGSLTLQLVHLRLVRIGTDEIDAASVVAAGFLADEQLLQRNHSRLQSIIIHKKFMIHD